MAAGDSLYYCNAQPTGAGKTGIRAYTFGIGVETSKVTDPGPAGNPGEAGQMVSARRVKVSVDFLSLIEALGWLEQAKGSFTGFFKGVGGTNEKVVVTNVVFTDGPSEVTINAQDGGGKVPVFRISGYAQWGSADTWASVIAFSAV